MNENLIPNAGVYARQHQLELADTLGSGKDGIVLAAKSKDRPGRFAIKSLHWPEAYERERKVYERLENAAVVTVLGFSVPQLVGFDDDLLVLELTIVERPFVLDFCRRISRRAARVSGGCVGRKRMDLHYSFHVLR